MTPDISVHQLITLDAPQHLHELSEVLLDCVEGGASVNFMASLSMARALAFWQQVAQQVQSGERALLVAQDGAGHIIGTVQLALSQPDNQPRGRTWLCCKQLYAQDISCTWRGPSPGLSPRAWGHTA